MDIKVLGSGCSNCKTTAKLIEEIAAQNHTPITLEKIENIQDIMKYNILSTPGVVIDGKVVHAGGIPSREKVQLWLSSPAPTSL